MSFVGKRELLAQVAPRYAAANRAHKSTILDEFVAATGYSWKYAMRLLARPTAPAEPIRRPRERRYGAAVQEALRTAWAAANYICAKRLVPFLPTLIDALERHGQLELSEDVRRQLLRLSPATADRILRPLRKGTSAYGKSTTRHGALLKHRVPVRTFAQWDDSRPGFTEADLVAHCGTSVSGAFLRSLVVTDVASGWTECLALRNGGEGAVLCALVSLRRLLPFDLLGLDTDNGSEFINEGMLAYCNRAGITFTRGRAYRKNDQCFVEQKNGSIVRQLVGYDRYEGDAAYRQLTELYRAVRLYVNFFQPSMKLVTKRRDGSQVRRTYDAAQTPFQRLAMSGTLSAEATAHLTTIYQAIDPVLLLRQVRCLQDALWRLASPAPPSDDRCPSDDPGITAVRFRADSCILGDGVAADCRREVTALDTAESVGAMRKRNYRRSGRSSVPRTYRTRADPFDAVREALHEWFLAAPETTAKGLLERLQAEHPNQYPSRTLRTLQRRVRAWRSETVLVFDETAFGDDGAATDRQTTTLRAFVISASDDSRASMLPEVPEADTDG